jgi:hypothetical protein
VKPVRWAPACWELPLDDSELVIDYPQADFDADIEERPIDDPRLAATWGPWVFRIVLAAMHAASQSTAHLEITQAPASRQAGCGR